MVLNSNATGQLKGFAPRLIKEIEKVGMLKHFAGRRGNDAARHVCQLHPHHPFR